ncbi:unnamed protein product [Alopecurus aequalis]
MAGWEDTREEEQQEEYDTDKTDTKEPMPLQCPACTSEVHLAGRENLLPAKQAAEPDPKEVVLQNPVKLLHLVHQLLLILAVVTCATIHYTFGSEGMVVGLVSTPETGMFILVMVLDLIFVWMYSRWSIFGDLKTYLRTVAIVLQDYALLIMLNRKYIEIAIIPFTFVAFMYALASNDSKYQMEEVKLKVWPQLVTLWKGLTKSAKELIIMAVVPYLLLLGLVVWTQYMGHIFIFTSFLLFLGSALCALTVMIASSPPIGVSDGADEVLPVMLKTCMVMLILTAHSMAAEGLGKNIVFACMPELISVLAWFTIYFHHPEDEVIINTVTSRRSVVIVVSSFVAILLCMAWYTEDMIILTVFLISSSSSALSYLDVCLLDKWSDGSTPNTSRGLVQLLKFCSLIGSSVSACIAAAYMTSPMLPYLWSMLDMLLGLVSQYMLPVFGSMLDMLLGLISQHMLPFVGSILAMLLDWLAIRPIRSEMQRKTRLTISSIVAFLKHILCLWHHPSLRFEGSDDYHHSIFKSQMQEIAEHLRCLNLRRMDEKEITEGAQKFSARHQLSRLYGKYNATNAKYLEEILLANRVSKRPKVVCISGLGRCGKSATATKVYKHIKKRFIYHLWVKMGENPDIAQLIENMITKVNSQKKYAGEGNKLTLSLGELLQKERYLVVLDDLWSKEDWRKIESYFPQDNPRSRIIITTRFEAAAKAVGDHLCWIPAPREADVDSLFSRNISGSLSGVFANKPHRKQYAVGLQWNELEQMKQSIKVRYNSLSARLRRCLLYLSIFPEKHQVEIDRLVRIWLALGFGGSDYPLTGKTARSYIDKLIAKNLIHQSSYNDDGTLRSCTIHPLIHEFIVWQATENEYVSLVHKEQRDSPSSYSKVRWLSFQNSNLSWSKFFSRILKRSFYMQLNNTRPATYDGVYLFDARSVTAFSEAVGIPPLTKLEKVRVLDLEGCEGPVCLDGLCELMFLRYLGLRGTYVSELSEKIGDLIYLQTLDVRSTKINELPHSIVKLENLMHLLAGNTELPRGISKMKALVTVSCASTMESSSTANIKELGEIPSLRELELFHGVTQRSEDSSLPSIFGNKRSRDERISFLRNWFPSLVMLRIQRSRASVFFKKGTLQKLDVLEINFDTGVQMESVEVFGMDDLPDVNYVRVNTTHQGRGIHAASTAARTGAVIDHRNHPKFSALGYTSYEQTPVVQSLAG